jgi:hypothetical protein
MVDAQQKCPGTQVYSTMRPRAICWLRGPNLATSLYSQWDELKLTDIGHQKALFSPLYSVLSPHCWLSCGVVPRGSCGSSGPKLTTSLHSQWDELKLTDIGHQRALFLLLYSDLPPHRRLSCGVVPRGVLRGPCGCPGPKLTTSLYSQ